MLGGVALYLSCSMRIPVHLNLFQNKPFQTIKLEVREYERFISSSSGRVRVAAQGEYEEQRRASASSSSGRILVAAQGEYEEQRRASTSSSSWRVRGAAQGEYQEQLRASTSSSSGRVRGAA
jgi:hypothetical protein